MSATGGRGAGGDRDEGGRTGAADPGETNIPDEGAGGGLGQTNIPDEGAGGGLGQTNIPGEGTRGGLGQAEARKGLGQTNIPDDHPRAKSLRTRERLKQAYEDGLIHATGLIAHGRGEAFDYLLGERTPPEALEAVAEAARLLSAADHPVLSLNGNVVALDAGGCLALQDALPSLVLEVNVFHRTEDRVQRLVHAMEAAGAAPGSVLGESPDARIPGLASDRGLCCRAGIGEADVVLVPLEDGDRCEALKAMGKTVVTIDLNPLSRTARTADVAIVDELTRALACLDEALRALPPPAAYDNRDILARVRTRMAGLLGADPAGGP